MPTPKKKKPAPARIEGLTPEMFEQLIALFREGMTRPDPPRRELAVQLSAEDARALLARRAVQLEAAGEKATSSLLAFMSARLAPGSYELDANQLANLLGVYDIRGDVQEPPRREETIERVEGLEVAARQA